jgi:excisionase family DNA binding protein
MNIKNHYNNINYSEIGFLNRVQMAQFLGVSQRKLSMMVSSRQIPVIRIGRSVRFDLNKVIRALEKYTIEED